MGGWVPELTEKKAGFFPPMKTQTDQTKGGMILWSLLIALDWINLWLEPSTQEHTHLTPLIWHGSTLFFSSLASEANLVSVKAAENLIKKRSRVSGRQGKRARASERERKCGLVMKNCLLAHRVTFWRISLTQKKKNPVTILQQCQWSSLVAIPLSHGTLRVGTIVSNAARLHVPPDLFWMVVWKLL